MPTTYAHFRLGEEVRKQLPDSLQNIIDQEPKLFHIGVHGPDHLFYYNPIMKNKIGKLGGQIHGEPGRLFFIKAARVIHKCKDKAAHRSYVYGYLCHFAMDYVCHGYIGQQMKKTGLSHYEIEAEYDRRLLETDGFDPVGKCLTSHLNADRRNAGIIADFYDTITEQQVHRSLKGMIFFLNLLCAPSKKKRNAIFGAMKAVGMYDSMHGLVMNYEENPKCTETTDELVRRFPQAVQLAVRLITEYDTYLQQGGTLSDIFYYNFESEWVENV